MGHKKVSFFIKSISAQARCSDKILGVDVHKKSSFNKLR